MRDIDGYGDSTSEIMFKFGKFWVFRGSKTTSVDSLAMVVNHAFCNEEVKNNCRLDVAKFPDGTVRLAIYSLWTLHAGEVLQAGYGTARATRLSEIQTFVVSVMFPFTLIC